MTFGEKVRRMREIKELSQTELGLALHMTQRKVSYMEHNQCEPSMDDIIALCCYFSVSADYLLGLPKGLHYPL